VKKIDEEAIANASRSEKNELLSNPQTTPYTYRIDRDIERWNAKQ